MKTTVRHICIVRLSAIGDVCHALATVQAIQRTFPEDMITWIVGQTESKLIADIPGIRIIVFEKRRGFKAITAVLRQVEVTFDILLHMQTSFRANVLAAFIPAHTKLGFPPKLAREFHSLVINETVVMPDRPHVLEAFQHFAYAIGVPKFEPRWQLPIPKEDYLWIDRKLPKKNPIVVIAPSASNPERNWLASRYACVADYVTCSGHLPVLTGSPSDREVSFAKEISSLVKTEVVDLSGQTSLKQLLALISRATLVVAPDSGIVHLATTQGTPVVGLYAHSNPNRTGPYLSSSLTVEVYTENLLRLKSLSPESVKWGTRLKGSQLMEDISLDQVLKKVNLILAEDN